MLLSEATDRDLVESLRSTVCPACGRTKKTRQTLCLSDYRRLPHGQRVALYDLLGDGYREAIGAAFVTLKVSEFRTPEPKEGK